MSSETAIRAHDIGKMFPVFAKPHHRLMQMLPGKRQWYRQFQALKNVNLEVGRGETVGLIGRNGSGKSTLLQIICGTLMPTSGEIEVGGRIAALLELGAGFNPEFTGRENVFLNGTVLGLSRDEVERRFDDILAFADIGGFIDQPVKTYSSGMYVRLAFAVAINVTPDILIVDEALSVGDEAFQRKCFARIQAIRDAGATVLFVSHSASTVVELCDRAILLDAGELICAGPPKDVVSQYQKLLYAPPERTAEIRRAILEGRSSALDASDAALATADPPRGPAVEAPRAYWEEGMRSESAICYAERGARILDPHVQTPDGSRVNMLVAGARYVYTYQVRFETAAAGVRFGMMIRTITGVEVGGAASSMAADAVVHVAQGEHASVRFDFKCLLSPGTYFANAGVLASIGEGEEYLARIIDAFMFKVLPDPKRLATGIVDLEVAPQVQLG